MLLGAKKVAVSGLLAAVTVLLMILSTVIESSSLFFVAAASFCVGIVIREWGVTYGFGFLLASVFLNLMIAPNKFYCITFAGMGFYIVFSEWLWRKIADKAVMSRRSLKLWLGKYLIFNILYIPVILFMPGLLFTKEVTDILLVAFWAVGQIALFVFDYAYRYFQGAVWGKLRKKLL